MKNLALIILCLFLILAYPFSGVYGAETLSKDVAFNWSETLTISEISVPFALHIPATLSIHNLPASAEPGTKIEIQATIKLKEGSTLSVNGEAFNIDGAVQESQDTLKEFDLSPLRPVIEHVLAKIIQAQLKMGEDQSKVFASALAEYTHLSLINQVVVKTQIRGPAQQIPLELQLGVNDASKGTIEIAPMAKDAEIVDLIYECAWLLVLKLDLSPDVYNNAALSSLITQLTQMIGLPLQKTIGEKKADQTITHSLEIKAPFVWTPKLIGQIVLVIAIIIIIIILLTLKFPRKPSWE